MSFQDEATLPRPLKEGEVRYMVKDLRPFDGELADGAEKKRMCVKDAEKQTRRFEATEYEPRQPVLVLVPDEGPKEYPLLWFLGASGFRTVWLPDPLHRLPRDLEDAARECDCWAMILDLTYTMNFNTGPFRSCAWHEQLVQGLDDFVKAAGAQGELFVEMYCRICEDKQTINDAAAGSEEHYAQTFRSLACDDMLRSVGEKVKWTRWSSFDVSLARLFPIWHSKLLILSVLALRMGLVASPSDLPFWSGGCQQCPQRMSPPPAVRRPAPQAARGRLRRRRLAAAPHLGREPPRPSRPRSASRRRLRVAAAGDGRCEPQGCEPTTERGDGRSSPEVYVWRPDCGGHLGRRGAALECPLLA